MTKQEVRNLLDSILKSKDKNYANYSLGLMHSQERLFLSKNKIIKTVRVGEEVYDLITDPVNWHLYWELKKEAEKDRRAARLSGIDDLVRSVHN